LVRDTFRRHQRGKLLGVVHRQTEEVNPAGPSVPVPTVQADNVGHRLAELPRWNTTDLPHLTAYRLDIRFRPAEDEDSVTGERMARSRALMCWQTGALRGPSLGRSSGHFAM
jgi:hypothetical protein